MRTQGVISKALGSVGVEVVKAAGKHLLCLFEVKEENKNQAEWRRIIGVLSGKPCSLARPSVAAMERRLSDLQP